MTRPGRGGAVLVTAMALLTASALPASAAAIRVKIVTVFSTDPNAASASAVGAIKVVVGGVSAITGDGTDAKKCLGGSNFRALCSVASECPGSTCSNPGDNDGDGTDDDGFGSARAVISSGGRTVGIPTADLVDEFGALYRVGSVRIEETATSDGSLCKPASSPEGNVSFLFSEDAVNTTSASDYTVAIRIVPLDAPEFTGGVVCNASVAAAAEKARRKCARKVADSSADYVKARAKALEKCYLGNFRRDQPISSCLAEPDTGKTIEKAKAKLRTAIETACGGKNKDCNTADDDDVDPEAIGFPFLCPNFGGADCPDETEEIVTCFDVATCVLCIDAATVDPAMSLFASVAIPASDKRRVKCAQKIVKAGTEFLVKQSSLRQSCWDKRLNGKHNNACPNPGDGKTQPALAQALETLDDKICNACGGSQVKGCAGTDNFSPEQLGFPEFCLDVAREGFGETVPCNEEPTVVLTDIVDCISCVAEAHASCADVNAVPSFASYPNRCSDLSTED